MSDSDSDPDFVNKAIFTYEKPAKKKGKGRRGRDAKEEEEEVIAETRREALIRRHGNLGATPAMIAGRNPLLAYFGNTSDLFQMSDDEDGDALPLEEDEDEDEDVSEKDDAEESIALRSTLHIVRISKPGSDGEDSVTEPESDSLESVPPVQLSIKRRSPMPVAGSSKRRKLSHDSDSSSTEPDSGTECMTPPFLDVKAIVSLKSKLSSRDDEGFSSATEPDSVYEIETTAGSNPKPAFTRPTSQGPPVPFVLDVADGIAVPASINAFLREYQRDGIQFFWERWRDGRGGILGDDMGKTIQVIAFLSAIMKKHGDERDLNRRRQHVSRLQDDDEWRLHKRLPPANATWPTCLIIAPSTVVHNWERELDVWGYFEFGMCNGTPEERQDVLHEFEMGRLDIVLTSFDTARRDIELFYDLPFSCIFVDEAHKLKNPRSKITDAYNQFASRCRFGLTGTAIQNSYHELWTLLSWSNPKALGTAKQWDSLIAKPMMVGQSSGATDEEKAKAKIVARVLVDKILPKFFLRRTKDLILTQLPKKTDQVVFCPLTIKQIDIYKRILATEDVQDLINKDQKCSCGSGEPQYKCHRPWFMGHIFRYMSILIKISNHPALLLPSPMDSEEQAQKNRELAEVAFEGEEIPRYGPTMLLPHYCGKWNVLNMLLREWRKDRTNKVLIFTKSVKLLGMLEFQLSKNNHMFCKLDGSTKQSDRMPMIDKFNNDPEVYVFLISTLAGGTGLNLTGANKVVIFDPNWNPAHDLQAMDRAYRFGQTRDVFVYRLIGAGSIEELIYARQVYKQQQMRIGYEASDQTRYFSGIQGDSKNQGELFGLKNIFRLHEDTLATKMAIEKANLAEFNWALANMEGKATDRRKSANNGASAVGGDGKGVKDDADMRGMASLMLDDDVPSMIQTETVDDIQEILNNGGIKYSHHNNSILRSSKVEEAAWRATLKEKKRKAVQRKSQGSQQGSREREKTPEPEWPPKRKHHKAPRSNPKLISRQKALLETGIIASLEELPAFAVKFGNLPPSEQQRILGEMDNHTRKSRTS